MRVLLYMLYSVANNTANTLPTMSKSTAVKSLVAPVLKFKGASPPNGCQRFVDSTYSTCRTQAHKRVERKNCCHRLGWMGL